MREKRRTKPEEAEEAEEAEAAEVENPDVFEKIADEISKRGQLTPEEEEELGPELAELMEQEEDDLEREMEEEGDASDYLPPSEPLKPKTEEADNQNGKPVEDPPSPAPTPGPPPDYDTIPKPPPATGAPPAYEAPPTPAPASGPPPAYESPPTPAPSPAPSPDVPVVNPDPYDPSNIKYNILYFIITWRIWKSSCIIIKT